MPHLHPQDTFTALPIYPLGPHPLSYTLHPSTYPKLLHVIRTLSNKVYQVGLGNNTVDTSRTSTITTTTRHFTTNMVRTAGHTGLRVHKVNYTRAPLVRDLLTTKLNPHATTNSSIHGLVLDPNTNVSQRVLLSAQPLTRRVLNDLRDRPHFRRLDTGFTIRLSNNRTLTVLRRRRSL